MTNAATVAADADYSLDFADGTVVGANAYGQIAGLSAFSDVIDIAAGEEHSLVTFRDGTVSGDIADGRISGLSDLQGVLDIEAGFDAASPAMASANLLRGQQRTGAMRYPRKVANANYVLDIRRLPHLRRRHLHEGGRWLRIALADSVSQGIAHPPVWGAHEEESYQTGDKQIGFAFYRSVALGDNADSRHSPLGTHRTGRRSK